MCHHLSWETLPHALLFRQWRATLRPHIGPRVALIGVTGIFTQPRQGLQHITLTRVTPWEIGQHVLRRYENFWYLPQPPEG